jgi:uncharacterized protein (TIGR03086 family)
MIDDPRQLHSRSLAEFDARVRAVRHHQWGAPTPCEDWDVRDLVSHLINENRWAVPLLEGKTIEQVGDTIDSQPVGPDAVAAWDESARAARKAVALAADLDKTVHLSYGDRTVEHYLFEYANDLLVHAWDLARAIGADETLDTEAVEASYARIAPREDDLKASGLYGGRVEVAPGADTQTRLLAVCGRRP